MKNKSYTKRIIAFALSLIVIVGLMPFAVFADGTYTFPSYSQSGDNNSMLRYYLTDENAGSITVKQVGDHPALYLSLDEGWYFDKWDTYFNGYEDRPILSDPVVEGSNPVSDEGNYTFFNINQKQPFSNTALFLYIATGTGFYGDHRVTAVLKPILTVNAGDGVEYQVTTNYPSYADLAANQVAVKHGDNATITYTVDDNYVVTGVSANYGTNYSDNGNVVTVSSIIKPATITINTKLKCEINFNANGGTGVMGVQSVPQGVDTALNANTFTRAGYTFIGWNTAADGSGTAYTDKQTISTNNNITLYAQWDKLPADAPQFTVTSDIEDTYQSERTIGVVVDKKSGYTYSYQWYKNTENTTTGGTAIDGAVNDSYRLPVNTPVGTHYYYCVVTAARNDNGEAATQTSRVVTVKLNPIIIDGTMVTLSNNLFTYNGQAQKPAVSVSYNGSPLAENTDYTIIWPTDCKNVGNKPVSITFKGNYGGNVQKAFDIKPKTVTVLWENTQLQYNGQTQKPTAKLVGVIDGDDASLNVGVIGGESKNVGTYTAFIDSSPLNYTYDAQYQQKEFKIINANQTAPVVNKTDETISGKNDGTITNLTAEMEYRAEGETEYTAITGTVIENLADGKYYVRYKGKAGYNASPDAEVVIAAGRMLTVTYKADGRVVGTVEVEYGEDATAPQIPQKEGYSAKWEKDGRCIIADTEIQAVYTEEKQTDTPNSPQTEDPSNLWLWLTLLLASGAGVFGITLYDRKRKASSKR